MGNNTVKLAVVLIVLNISGLFVYDLLQNKQPQQAYDTNQIIESIKNDPTLSKRLEDIIIQNKSSQAQSPTETEDPTPELTNSETATQPTNTTTYVTNQTNTTVTSAGPSLNSLLPTQSGNSGKLLGTDGSSASWVSTTSGFPKLNSVVAPRSVKTTITADQVKSGLMVEVAPSDGSNGDRPKIAFPSPIDDASLRGYIVQLVAQPRDGSYRRMGASFGYPGKDPGFLGDLATLSPNDLNFSDTPVTIIYEVNGVEKQSTLTQDYTTQPQNILADIFSEALLEDTITLQYEYDPPGNNTPSMSIVLTTRETGENASISIVDPGLGDPLGLGALTASPGFSGYRGYNQEDLGVGELNEDNIVGGGYTHTWPDDPYGMEQQTLTVVATSTGWRALKTATRSEFVSFSPTQNFFLGADDKNLGKIINSFDEEIFDIRSRLDSLEQ